MMIPSNHTADPMDVVLDVEDTPAERARQREIISYLHAASLPEFAARRNNEVPDPENPIRDSVALSKDANLTALIQGAVLRTGFRRGFISLIDDKWHYVAAEATRTHSVSVNDKYVDPKDKLYCGIQMVDVVWSVCPKTMKYFADRTNQTRIETSNISADNSKYIIRDMHADSRFADCPYVVGFPFTRCYAEVPLITTLGYCIGTICVTHDELMPITNDTTDILTETANTIMRHLDLVRSSQNRARSEMLVEGLGCFLEQDCARPLRNEGREEDASSRGVESIGHGLESAARSPASASYGHARSDKHQEHDQIGTASHSVASGEDILPAHPGLHKFFSSGTVQTTAASSDDVLTGPETPATPSSDVVFNLVSAQSKMPPPASVPKDVDEGRQSLVSADVKDAFSRASELIRRAMNLEGVSFIDACPSSFASRSDIKTPSERANPFDTDLRDPNESLSINGAAPCPSTPAAVLARNIKNPVRFTAAIRTRQTSFLNEMELQRLIRKYPRGHIFSADQYGPIDERYRPGRKFPSRTKSDDRSETQTTAIVDRLFTLLKEARYLAFLPLWHFQRDTWYAATFCWTSDQSQGFDKHDLTYLSAFGNSLMAEVSRLEALALSRAKSDFISSISHELRSPLHGILASAELLKEAMIDSEQKPMVSMIESCGRTLLDTMEHLLDFAKINHLSNSSARMRGNRDKELIRKDKNTIIKTPVKFDVMLQDVAEAISIGHASKVAFAQDLQSTDIIPHSAEKRPPEHPVLVMLNIEKRSSWLMLAQIGAWKRIVMNLFGNALKYTRSGTIELALQLREMVDLQGNNRPHIVFAVKDTGIGMSAEYQRYFLFQPFAQENILAPGTGLGLSIVKQIVGSMGGRLEVQSAIGVGTQIFVYIPAEPMPSSDPTNDMLLLNGEKLKGKKIRILRAEEYPNHAGKAVEMQDADINHVKALHKAFTDLSAMWLDMEVLPHDYSSGPQSDIPQHDDRDADFHVVDKAVLGSERIDEALATIEAQGKAALLICYDPPQLTNRLRPGAVRLWHPLGPKKVAGVLMEALVAAESISQHGSPKRICLPSDHTPALPTPGSQLSQPLASLLHILTPAQKQMNLATPPVSRSPSAATVVQIKNETSSVSSPDTPMTADEPKKPHLLLVDDNPINLKLLSTLATRLKCTFSCATNGLEAANVFRAETLAAIETFQRTQDSDSPPSSSSSNVPELRSPYDLVIMDISMPIMNGFASTREIRSFERETSTLHAEKFTLRPARIVALTGLGNENDRREAFLSGMQVFLTKPAKLAEVRRLLEEIRLEDERPAGGDVGVAEVAAAGAAAVGVDVVVGNASQVAAQVRAAIAEGASALGLSGGKKGGQVGLRDEALALSEHASKRKRSVEEGGSG